jgi:hypothetical protein
MGAALSEAVALVGPAIGGNGLPDGGRVAIGASHSRLEPFKRFARMIQNHLDGILAWTRLWVSNGSLEGMNNKVKVVSHRAYGY